MSDSVLSGPVLLNNVDHHDLRVITDFGAEWGDAVNQTTVFAPEFEALSREYPIVFRRDAAGAFRAVALLGFEADENLYLDGQKWEARAIPALMTRGPFSIGLPSAGGPGEAMIHITPDHPRISRERGQRIFLDHGGNTPYLDYAAGMLRSIYAGTQIGPAMIEAFDEAGLLEPVTLRMEAPDGRCFVVPDVWTLSQERFAALDGAALARLNAGDFLRCAVWLMSSLDNLSALLDRKLARGS
ncbi:SapC protein [Novosphingobium sp. PhB165]|uniref:SapC family protein n=1 Tax=Novosphingobium sp. PhB165 TaxID=2485105 RepID=UPI00104C8178|nr:SapC family protein [Novosphingobium sp. PhB165]TCM20538.1 SapC protein [Novosphingobium sp. PhB165]